MISDANGRWNRTACKSKRTRSQRAEAKRDEAARKLLGDHAEPLRGLAHQYAPSAGLVDDFEQEAQIAFIRAANAYKSQRGATLKTFGLKCAKRRLISAIRRESAQYPTQRLISEAPAPEEPEELIAISETLAGGENDADQNEKNQQAADLQTVKARVGQAVIALPKRQRQIVRLHFWDQMPLHAIASMLHVSASRVSAAMRDARAILRHELAEFA